VSILWILIPSPFVGYLMIDSLRKVFSDDDTLLRKLFADQPVTMIATSMSLGSMVVWALSEAVLRIL
jgi:hypothetical protein|tara:strand:+ start:483 stop:683 length:201 start_codon:yes stop_codon:yes gene_type:complete